MPGENPQEAVTAVAADAVGDSDGLGIFEGGGAIVVVVPTVEVAIDTITIVSGSVVVDAVATSSDSETGDSEILSPSDLFRL